MTDSNTTLDKADVLKKAYRKATSRLRDANRDQFETFMQEEAAKHGVEYVPSRVQREAKARDEIARLAAQHGIPVSFKVETAEDAQRNVENLQSTYGHSVEWSAEDEQVEEPVPGDVIVEPTLYQHLRGAAVEAEQRDAERGEQA